MGYFSEELQPAKFGLEEDNAEDFYCCCFQRSRSAIPFLIIRCIVLTGCLGIIISSWVISTPSISFGMWWVFMTHWGLIFITVTAALAFAVSARACMRPKIDCTFGIPWYIKLYWVWFNLTLPIAFFITIFYYALLATLDQDFSIDPTLDVFIHGINSVLMLVLLLTSRHPSRLLHFHHAMLMGIVYLIFSLIYYFAGGEGPFGTGYIYPQLDWAYPGTAVLTALGSAVGICVMHLIVVGIAAGRDRLTKKYRNNSIPITNANERYY